MSKADFGQLPITAPPDGPGPPACNDNPRPVSVDHYENFPVASWLCPARLRPPIAAIYWFARTADDIADEHPGSAAERATLLQAYRAELHAVAAGRPPLPTWAPVFRPLQQALRDFALPVPLLDDLLSAFEQDLGNPLYPDRATLLDYCRRSANPIGRLLLHLHGLNDADDLARADAICSALQLINFWQDLSVDHPRGRCYLPADALAPHGLQAADLLGANARLPDRATRTALMAPLCAWAGQLMHNGAPLVHRLPGRAGWELRLVVQGGLAILEKIQRMNHDTFERRPVLGAGDAPALLWRSLWMPRAPRLIEAGRA